MISAETYNADYEKAVKFGYNKGIDEFAELLLSKLDVDGRDWYCAMKINEVAEQLKEEQE